MAAQLLTKYHKFNFYVGIDFGTDGLGLAYALKDTICIHQKWNSTRYGATVKPKAIILLDETGRTKSFGLEAKMTYMIAVSKRDKWMLFERFKMSLYAHKISNTEESEEKKHIDIADELTATNGKKYSSEKVFIAAFQHLQKETQIWMKKKHLKLKKEEIQWIVTVPAIWNLNAKNKMKQWAIKSGLIDKNIPNQCKIVYEPDCASLSIQHYIHKKNEAEGMNNIKFEKGMKYILVDAGGGTVDVACHEILHQYGVKEILPPSGGKWGSCFIDDQYAKLLEQLFNKEWMDEFKEKEPNVYVEIIHKFQQTKATFYSDPNADTHNVELPGDFCGFLEDKLEEDSDDEYDDIDEKVNEMEFMGKSNMIEKYDETLEINSFIWKKLFDHVITPTVKHVKKLLNEPRLMRNCKFLCLVGGLSCSAYFEYRMNKEFGVKSKYNMQVIIPPNPILSVVEGAAYFGITQKYIKGRMLSATYGIKKCIPLERAMKLRVPNSFIEENKFYNQHKQRSFMRNYFDVLIAKRAQIDSTRVITRRFYRQRPSQKTVSLFIVCTDVENPKMATKNMELGSMVLCFDENDNGMALQVEFHFYDTILRVYAYSINNPQTRKEVILKYHR